MPWLVFSWVSLGSAIPDTLVLKQAATFGDFTTGLWDRYSGPYPNVLIALAGIGAVAITTVLSWPLWRLWSGSGSSVVPALAAAGTGYFATIATLGVPPFFWYYAPTVAALTICASIGLARLLVTGWSFMRLAGLIAAVGIGVLIALPWVDGLSQRAPLRTMLLHGNWAYPGEYASIGAELGAEVGDTPVQSPGEVGGLIYHCHCVMTDRFSERAQILDDIEQRIQESWLMRLNYRFLEEDDVRSIDAELALRWRPGPDLTGRGWDAHGIVGGRREVGHFELVAIDRTGRRSR